MATTDQGVTTETPVLSFEDEMLSRWSVEDPAKEPVSDDPEVDEPVDEGNEADDVDQDADEVVEEDEDTDTDPEDDSGDEDPEEDPDTEDDDAAEPATLDDKAKVSIKVDGKEIKVSVKDLKRLYGQEASLTQKSQQVAEQRKEVEASNTRAAAQLDRIHAKVSARWEPYSKIDMLVASTQLEPEQFAALRAEANAAYEDFRFITQEVDEFVQTANTQRQTALQTQAKEAVKVLTAAIPDWSQTLYDQIRTYAIDKGMDANTINSMVDPAAIQMLHKAMRFDQAKSVKTTKVVKKVTKVLKTTKAVTSSDAKVDSTAKAAQRLKASGSTDDAASLFMARWAKD